MMVFRGIILTGLVLLPSVLMADSVSISNSVTTSATTQNGTSQSSVDIVSTVNGEVVEEVHKREQGTSTRIDHYSEISVEGEDSKVEIQHSSVSTHESESVSPEPVGIAYPDEEQQRQLAATTSSSSSAAVIAKEEQNESGHNIIISFVISIFTYVGSLFS